MKTCRKKLHQYPDNLKGCPECKKGRDKRWNDSEKGKESKRKWAHDPKNQPYMKKKHRKDAQSLKRKSYLKQYKTKPEVKLAHAIRQSKRTIIAAQGDLTIEEWKLLLNEFEFCCAYCHIQLLTSKDGVNRKHSQYLNIDHIVPLMRNKEPLGQHTLHNVLPACRACNKNKSNRDVWEWVESENINLTPRVYCILIKAITLHQEFMETYNLLKAA